MRDKIDTEEGREKYEKAYGYCGASIREYKGGKEIELFYITNQDKSEYTVGALLYGS
jgi:hypothetical protein